MEILMMKLNYNLANHWKKKIFQDEIDEITHSKIKIYFRNYQVNIYKNRYINLNYLSRKMNLLNNQNKNRLYNFISVIEYL